MLIRLKGQFNLTSFIMFATMIAVCVWSHANCERLLCEERARHAHWESTARLYHGRFWDMLVERPAIELGIDGGIGEYDDELCLEGSISLKVYDHFDYCEVMSTHDSDVPVPVPGP